MFHFYNPWNLRFSVFRGYRSGTLVENGLIHCFLSLIILNLFHANALFTRDFSDAFRGYRDDTLGNGLSNFLNLLSINPTKWSNALKQFVDNCRRIVWVFDHFVGLALKGLNLNHEIIHTCILLIIVPMFLFLSSSMFYA